MSVSSGLVSVGFFSCNSNKLLSRNDGGRAVIPLSGSEVGFLQVGHFRMLSAPVFSRETFCKHSVQKL